MFQSSITLSVILLGSGVFAMGLAKWLGFSPVIGFFFIGAVIGSHGLGLVDSDAHGLHILGELGVCFLMFDIGIHLSIKTLKETWKSFIILGSLQFLMVSSGLISAGMLMGLPWVTSLVLGTTLSLSSTALVLKLLSDEREQDTPVGKSATEILVFQDLIAIVLLILIDGAASGTVAPLDALTLALGKVILAATLLVVIGRKLLRPFFGWITAIKSDEVFTASALFFVLLAAWLTERLGLSLALGAFLGGLALSESSYSYMVRTEIAPFRGLLLSLFFLSVGMSLDLGLMRENIVLLLLVTVLYLAIKIFFTALATRALSLQCGAGTRLSFLLSQGSEFAFVLLASAGAAGFIASFELELLKGVIGVTLALTPFLGGVGCKAARCVAVVRGKAELELELNGEVVLVEFDDFAKDLAEALVREEIPYRGHDRDWDRLAYAKSRGFNVFYSDLNRPRTLSRASTGQVRAVICLAEDDEICRLLYEGLKSVAPNVPFLAATSDPKRFELYNELGVEDVFSKRPDAVKALFETLLFKLGTSEEGVRNALARFTVKDEEQNLFPRMVPAPQLGLPQAAAL